MSVKSSRSHVYVNMKGEPRGFLGLPCRRTAVVKLQQAIPARERKETKQPYRPLPLSPLSLISAGLSPRFVLRGRIG